MLADLERTLMGGKYDHETRWKHLVEGYRHRQARLDSRSKVSERLAGLHPRNDFLFFLESIF
jgi:hypothetical protein